MWNEYTVKLAISRNIKGMIFVKCVCLHFPDCMCVDIQRAQPAQSRPHPRSVLFLRVHGHKLGNAPRLSPVFLWTTAAVDFLRIPARQNVRVMSSSVLQRWRRNKPLQSTNNSYILYAFFRVIPPCLNFICQCFGTLCSIFIGGSSIYLRRWDRQSVPKRRHIKFRCREITQRGNIQHSEQLYIFKWQLTWNILLNSS
jgi:hypothetical protein